MPVNNIEEVFGVIEMGNLLSNLDSMFKNGSVNSETLLEDFKTFIAQTLENNTYFPNLNDDITRFSVYDNFVKNIIKPAIAMNEKVSVITFNYDLGLDHAFEKNGLRFTYGFHKKPEEYVKLLKLHGSINWYFKNTEKENKLETIKCEEVSDFVNYPEKYEEFGLRSEFRDKYIKRDIQYLPFQIYVNMLLNEAKGEIFNSSPFIIPPSWNKVNYYKQIQPVWSAAVKELEEAQNIYFIGYSVPPSDSFFKHLIGIAALSDEILENIKVVNHSSQEDLKERYKAIFNNQYLNDKDFFEMKFEEFVQSKENLKVQ